MDQTCRLAIEQVLWPDGGGSESLWAVLDLARSTRIHVALLESRLEYRCLYSGRIARELELAAPHLVELPRGHRFVDRLLDEGFGHSWGVFLTVDDPSNLRHHLRRLLQVRDESGRDYLFRFYDPRVLRAWLPSCTPEQLARFFGPVKRWLAEGPGGRSLTDACLRGGLLDSRQCVLPAAVEAA